MSSFSPSLLSFAAAAAAAAMALALAAFDMAWYFTSGTPLPLAPPDCPGTPAPAKLPAVRLKPVGTHPAALVLELSFCITLCLMSSPFQTMSSSQLAWIPIQ